MQRVLKFYYFQWKKSRRFDVFTAKTRNVKRKLDGNSVNYMEKLLDEVETKRVKKSTVIDKEKHDPEKLTENLMYVLIIYKKSFKS